MSKPKDMLSSFEKTIEQVINSSIKAINSSINKQMILKKIKPNFKECPHCKFMLTLGEVQSNREYWIITEVFVHLHNGKDYCDFKEKN